ncbi:MAG: septation protein IspZ [Alphaproteobacteria bacterium]|nr:septation protein IspZ [Alphaproteobacteria bacterium]
MKQALGHLVSDFLSAIVFLIAYAVSGSLRLATAAAITVGFVQLVRALSAGRRIEPMQWASLALVVILGGTTMLTHDLRFMMLKPGIVHFAVAAVMLRRGWLARYVPEIVRRNVPEPVIVAAGYAWAALMMILGAVDFGFARHGNIAAWAWFISVGALGAKLVAFALQYAIFRAIIRQRLVASAAV